MKRHLMFILPIVAVAACSQNGITPGGSSGVAAPQGVTTRPVTVAPAVDPSSPAFFRETVGDRVLFEVDQIVLTPSAKATLDGQAQWLLANPSFSVTIEGHADEQGTREYNLALGARRARSVQEYLTTRGVPANRMRTLSYGKERPLAICSDESCYSRNRRSVTVLAGGLS